MLTIYKQEFAKLLSSEIKDLSYDDILMNIELVPAEIEGELGFPCFQLSKIYKKAPNQIAENISASIKYDGDLFEKVIAVGPYINVVLEKQYLIKASTEEILSKMDTFGFGEKKGETILLEGRQPNTHKAFHIGHVRNAVLSESMSRILEAAGYDVIRTSYIGDIGAHVAKWIWYYDTFYTGLFPSDGITRWAGKLYAQATQKVYESEEQYKAEINEVQKKLEAGDKHLNEIWKETREMCINDLNLIFSELSCTIDREYFESEVEKPGIQKVKELLKEGKVQKGDGGAIIMDLEQYKLGVFVLLKSNGTSLYSTKDIALAYLKQKEFKFDKSLYVVATEQVHHFNQLFKTLELIGFEGADKLEHLAYGLVTLKSGKMSSRDGNVILYEDLRDQLHMRVEQLMEERGMPIRHGIIRDIVYGAMKFTMLLQDAHKPIIFDIDKVLSLQGETGPYIQYAYARCCTLMKDADIEFDEEVDFSLATDREKKLMFKSIELGEIIQKAALEYKPNYIARYLLELTKMFNSYYQAVPILKCNKEEQKFRLRVVDAVRQSMAVALTLLGMMGVEEM